MVVNMNIPCVILKHFPHIHRRLAGCLILLCFAASFSVSTWAQGTNLRSFVDRTKIGIDETLQLTVRYSGPSQQDQPSFTHLKSQFDILSTTQSNQFRSINGQVTSYTDWVMTLSPKREGRLIIPSFRLGSLISDAVEITVTPAQQNPNDGAQDVYLETDIDTTSVYVQEQVRITYRLFFALNVNSLDNPEFTIDNVIIDKLPDARYDKRINGRHYGVAEFSYALFPQESGEFVIPSQRWTVSIPRSGQNRSFFGLSGRVETRRLRTEEKTVEVKPRPDTFPSGETWLPAENVTLQESWSTNPENLKVGEPVTRTITLKAKGVLASQLPPVWSGENTSAVKTYADQPDLNEERSNEGLQSVRVESAAVVINSAGDIRLPAIKLPWWDTSTDTLQYAALPERIIKATRSAAQGPAPQANNIGASNTTNSGNSSSLNSNEANAQIAQLTEKLWFWRYLSVGLFILLSLATMAIYFLSKRSATAPTHNTRHTNSDEGPRGEAKAFKTLLIQCQSGDASKVRSALLTWGKYHWQPAPTTLDTIGENLGNSDIKEQLRCIDAELFGGQSDTGFDGNKLAALLQTHKAQAHTKEDTSSLTAFYPNQG